MTIGDDGKQMIPCPFVYSTGEKCPGHISGWQVYGPGMRNGETVPFQKARKVRLWCSVGHDHQGPISTFETKERMEFYPNQLPAGLADIIWPKT